ncbi:hypothetical protein GCM10020000_07390 [Streptomyces olivoverticillatus]
MRPVPDLRPPGPVPGREPVTVALSGVDFGWGSSGKLSAVLSALSERSPVPLRFVGLDSGLGQPVLAEHPVEHWYDLPDSAPDVHATVDEVVRFHRVRAAVVVLDGRVAKTLEAVGVPTVFVDSLPFLWTDGDRPALPLDATVYCAQRCLELPPECEGVLASIPGLRWVEAVIGTPPAPRAERRAGRPCRKVVVSLGGLRAPLLADWTNYPRVVLPAVLEALATHGVREVRLVSNLPAGLLAEFIERAPAPLRVTAGLLPHRAFLAELADCDALLASPGLTTLLEAGSLGVPTVCLPPQNLSQIFNARAHSRAVGADVRAAWPEDVLREDEALALRSKGEKHALDLIYTAIGKAAARADDGHVVAALSNRILAALRQTTETTPDWGALTAAVGTGGAAQVADAVLAAVRQSPPDT